MKNPFHDIILNLLMLLKYPKRSIWISGSERTILSVRQSTTTSCIKMGIPTVHRNYDDVDEVVNQEPTFWYLFGVQEPDCYAIIDNASSGTYLFVPRLDQSLKMWMTIKSFEQFKKAATAVQVMYVDQMENWIKGKNPTKIYLYHAVDSDSGLQVQLPDEKYWNWGPPVDKTALWQTISNCRVIKTQQQIKLMRYVCDISSQAHISALKSTRAGLKQMQMHSVFLFEHATKTGSEKTAFHSICSSGHDCATLHYIDNDKLYKPGQLALHDMGGKWYGYCADIAITFPVDGKFTKKQREIYHAVYSAQKAVLDVLKPGVNWEDMHLLAQRVIIQHLIQLGLINKFPMEELVEKRIGAIFFPHGLGHFLGLKVHDLGGYTKGDKKERSKLAGLKSLRTRRDMQVGMIITVEPGCYFIDFMIQKALEGEKAKYLNKAKIEQYKEVGGVRLQDDVLITADGIEVLSKLPRHWQEVQKLLAEQ